MGGYNAHNIPFWHIYLHMGEWCVYFTYNG
jgi:hypothetical protein